MRVLAFLFATVPHPTAVSQLFLDRVAFDRYQRIDHKAAPGASGIGSRPAALSPSETMRVLRFASSWEPSVSRHSTSKAGVGEVPSGVSAATIVSSYPVVGDLVGNGSAQPMYDPHDMLQRFTFRARPEACIGSPETIEAYGRELARSSKPSSSGQLLRLISEPAPPGTPPGWKAYRFTEPKRVTLGTVCGVVYDKDTDNTVFVMTNASPADVAHSGGPPSFTTRQDTPEVQESHILIPPNGYVSPELIVSDDDANSGGGGQESRDDHRGGA